MQQLLKKLFSVFRGPTPSGHVLLWLVRGVFGAIIIGIACVALQAVPRRLDAQSGAIAFGGILLGGIVAAYIPALDPELFDDLHRLTLHLEADRRIPQPRLRHRLQTDRIGLQRSVHRLRGEGEDLAFELADKGSPAHHILAAV